MLEYIIIGFLGVLLVLIFLIYQKINTGDSLGVERAVNTGLGEIRTKLTTIAETKEKIEGLKGEMVELKTSGLGKTRIVSLVPSRGLIGYHSEFMTDTRGTGILNRVFNSWEPYKGSIAGRRQGVLISMENGSSVAYAIFNLEDRGKFFIGSGEDVYEGMIIGEHNRDNDLEVNPLKGKKLTNVRASGTDEAVRLTTPTILSLEQSIAYIDDDELVEVTPSKIRLRKRILGSVDRKRSQKIAS